MNAAEKSQQSWESLNEERLILFFEIIFSYQKLILQKAVIGLNLIAFVIYKLLFYLGLVLRALFLSSPIVRMDREEAWIYRQIK